MYRTYFSSLIFPYRRKFEGNNSLFHFIVRIYDSISGNTVFFFLELNFVLVGMLSLSPWIFKYRTRTFPGPVLFYYFFLSISRYRKRTEYKKTLFLKNSWENSLCPFFQTYCVVRHLVHTKKQLILCNLSSLATVLRNISLFALPSVAEPEP